jgi:RNA polymerase sigma factor (sigma-70 family)
MNPHATRSSYYPMWSLSDESLLTGLASGDRRSATAFVRRYQKRVFGLAFSILGDRQAAEDAAQETFVRAWRHAGAYDPRRGGVSTWLLTIARNVSVDMLRMRRHEPVDPEALLMQVNAGMSDSDEAARTDEVLELRRALSQLPRHQTRALVLAAFYGRTGREISEIEGVPLGTVKTRIRTAMMKLRVALEAIDD